MNFFMTTKAERIKYSHLIFYFKGLKGFLAIFICFVHLC